MKNLLASVLPLSLLLVLMSCNASAPTEEAEGPDYAGFEKNVEILRSVIQAHCDENIDLMTSMMADTMRWSPPVYNGNAWLGKDDFIAAVQGYHNDYEDITYEEGIVLHDRTVNGMWSGSVFPQASAQSGGNNVRMYGTWTATHSESGKEIGVKWFALGNVNADGKLASWSEYWDAHGLAAQIAAD